MDARKRHPAWAPENRIVIENMQPEIDAGRFPVKRVAGDEVEVSADIFRDGHDILAAVLKVRGPGDARWIETPMEPAGNDVWTGRFTADRVGGWRCAIEAWTDTYETWHHDATTKAEAGQDIGLELIEGRALLDAAAAGGSDAAALQRHLAAFDAVTDDEERAAVLTSAPVRRLMARHGERADRTAAPREIAITVDRTAARFAAWYEMFPRSQGTVPGRGATFDDCIRRLPEVQAMGFDVLYFVPVHPIGRINRKGPDNTLTPGPDDPGSPYAIGAAEGGHTAIHPELGTLADFDRLVTACDKHGMEVALDIALQCAPDHPWIAEHPEWFRFRPDGTIKHAENPPKKYQDIVNFEFYGPHRAALWDALKGMIDFWIGHGVKTFRVDNPHTKPLPFWEWLIAEVQAEHPDAIFLSEAFTRPKVMKALAKAGFTQSYTYFTWRNFKDELTAYLTELTQDECREYLRPNFFTSTPDILPPILQRGGRPAFEMRLVLAATLSGVYGIYNGYELCEAEAIPGTEEYASSEKYEHKVWDWDRPGNIKDTVTRVNRARRDNPALHEFLNLRFYPADSDSILFYGKMTRLRDSMVFVAVNLDPFEAHDAVVEFPLAEMGLADDDAFEAEDLLTDERHLWRGARHRIRLDPKRNPAAILRVAPFRRIDFATPCF
ncbi:MAG: alpha-1,4-glucan--maltose-1-phosphate maltosyltransferase [Rhodospirillales bacterium]